MLAPITKHIRRTFIAGSLLLIPVGLTYLVLRMMFDLVDGVLQPPIRAVLETWGLGSWAIPGLGVVATILLIYLSGFFFANTLGRTLVGWSQGLVLRVPLIGTVYQATRKLVESFSGSGGTGFKRVVMVQYPRAGAWSIGFLTGTTTRDNDLVLAIVYIPTAPLPNSGWVALIPIEEVYDVDLSIQAAMQLVFSGGIISPISIKSTKLSNTPEI